MGLDDYDRQHGAVFDLVVPVHPFPAADFDFRSARTGGAAKKEGSMNGKKDLYGLMAEFEHEEELVAAVRRTYEAGYRSMDAYTPFPVEGLAEEMGSHWTAIPAIVLAGGIIGG